MRESENHSFLGYVSSPLSRGGTKERKQPNGPVECLVVVVLIMHAVTNLKLSTKIDLATCRSDKTMAVQGNNSSIGCISAPLTAGLATAGYCLLLRDNTTAAGLLHQRNTTVGLMQDRSSSGPNMLRSRPSCHVVQPLPNHSCRLRILHPQHLLLPPKQHCMTLPPYSTTGTPTVLGKVSLISHCAFHPQCC